MVRGASTSKLGRSAKGDRGVGARDDSKERLIRAAGEVFAEVGFREARVREICTRAGVNIAAVNYYFGDKEGLYHEVIRHADAQAREKYPLAFDGGMGAEDALRVFVHMFMAKVLDEGRPAWHGKLMAREMVEPTAALDEIVKNTIRPTWDTLTGIVASVLGKREVDLLVEDCAASVIGQCLMFCHCRAVIDRLYPESRYTREQIGRLSEHIVRFSLAALGEVNTPRQTHPNASLREGLNAEPPPSRSKTRVTPPPAVQGEERKGGRRKAKAQFGISNLRGERPGDGKRSSAGRTRRKGGGG